MRDGGGDVTSQASVVGGGKHHESTKETKDSRDCGDEDDTHERDGDKFPHVGRCFLFSLWMEEDWGRMGGGYFGTLRI